MPVLHRIDASKQLIYYAGFGHCKVMEIAAAEEETRRDPQRSPGMRILIDMRQVEDLDVSLEDLQRGIDLNAQLASQGWELEKTAVLIRKPLDGIMAELYDEMALPHVQLQMAMFLELEPALLWLGLAKERDAVADLIADVRSRYQPAPEARRAAR